MAEEVKHGDGLPKHSKNSKFDLDLQSIEDSGNH